MGKIKLIFGVILLCGVVFAETSPIFINGNKVGIGTASPRSSLEISSQGMNRTLRINQINVGKNYSYRLQTFESNGEERWSFVGVENGQPGANTDFQFWNQQGNVVMSLRQDKSVSFAGEVESDVFKSRYHFEWVGGSPLFPNGSQHTKTYIDLGNIDYYGALEVTLFSDWSYSRTTGKITKVFDVVRDKNRDVKKPIYSEVSSSLGHATIHWRIGNPEVGSDNHLKIPIYHLTRYQNKIYAKVTGYNTKLWKTTSPPKFTQIESSDHSNERDHHYFAEMYQQNMGVGTKTPRYKMDIVGSDSRFVTLGLTNGYSKGRSLFTMTEDATGGSTPFYIERWGSQTDQPNHVNIVSVGDLAFSSGGTKERFRVHDTGQVSFGTDRAVDDYLVTIDGNLIANNIVTKPDIWADYVFEDTYQLMSIQDLKRFVRQNRHLPRVPSQKEVIGNGVSMTDMQVKLLEKVEELSLYVIQLHDRLSELEQEDS